MSQYIWLSLVAGFLLIPVSWFSLQENTPSFLSPGPMVLVIPLFLEIPRYIIVLIPTVLFWLWSFHLLKGEIQTPFRSLVLCILLIVLSGIDLLYCWPYGVAYQGFHHTLWMCLLNVFFGLMLILMACIQSVKPSFGLNLVFHFWIFLWLGWCAFPYLGENP